MKGQAMFNDSKIDCALGKLLLVLLGAATITAGTAQAFEWVPSDEEIQKYRNSWNPFSEISEHSYGNRLSTPADRKNGPTHLYSVSPLVTTTYGLTDHVELGAATSWNTFWARDSQGFDRGQGGPLTTNTGLGDLSLNIKYRPVVQDPDSSRPSFTSYTQIVLPTSRWITGTERPPGGFAPLGRLPATRFGELGFTEGLTFRKNNKPYRISGGVYYTYSAPGSDAGQTTYVGDIINTRLAYEHFLDDKQGLALN